jgi:hypothetical protein
VDATTKKAQARPTRRSPGYMRVTFDNPPLNVMGPEFVLEIREIMNALAHREGSVRADFGVAPDQGRALRGIKGDQAADPHCEWLQRHHGPDDQLLDHVAADPKSAADRLSRCRARCALPVPGAVPETQQAFPGFVTGRQRYPDSRRRPRCSDLTHLGVERA